jgi:GNAT superfamily N-acetyltransferase
VSGEEIQVRIATVADIREMHGIRTAVRENRLVNPLTVQPQDYAALMSTGGRAWVAEANGEMLGFAAADLRRFNVWALFVAPEFEGRGAGRRLHDRMMEWLFANGADHVWLSTDRGTRAESFYKAAGWRYAGEQTNGEARYELMREWWLKRRESTEE